MPKVDVRMPSLRREAMTSAQWYADVKNGGAVVTRVPEGNGIWSGVIAARFVVPGTTSMYYEVAPLIVRGKDASQAIDGALTKALGVAGDIGDSIGGVIEQGGNAVLKRFDDATSVTKLTPWWVKVAIGIGIYGALVQAGIAPPLRKLLK